MKNETYIQITDEAWNNYLQQTMFTSNPQWLEPVPVMNIKTGEKYNGARQYHKDGFLEKCKTDPNFSRWWELKIEERELSSEERYNIWFNNNYETGMERYFDPNDLPDFNNPYYDPTPSKLITVTYKDKTIKVYQP